MIIKEQVYDLYIAGYQIIEISSLLKCSERTIRRKLKEIEDEKSKNTIDKLKILGIDSVDIELIESNIKSTRYKIVKNKNEIIKLYLDGNTAKDIEEKEGYSRADVYNIIRNLKRKVGLEKFKELYEKIHIRNREKLLLEIKREKYNRDLMRLTGQEVRGCIGDRALFSFVSSAYKHNGKMKVLSKEIKKIATWDLPKQYK